VRTIAVLGFSKQGIVLLQSLLAVAKPQLKDLWELAEPADAELLLADSTQITGADLMGMSGLVVWVFPPSPEPPRPMTLSQPLRAPPLITLLNAVSARASKETQFQEQASLPVGSVGTSSKWEWWNRIWTSLGQEKFSAPKKIADTLPELSLRVPNLRAFHDPGVELNKREIRKWITQLALFNTNSSIPELIETLSGLSDEPLSAQKRVDLLNLYREAINALFHAIGTPMLRRTTLQNSEKGPIQLFLLSAECYKAAVLSYHQENKVWPLAIWLALEQTAYALVQAFRNSQSLPSGTYLEAHQLFFYALQCGIAEQTLQITYPGLGAGSQSGSTCISDLYKQLLLVSALDPYGLIADQFNPAMERFSKLATKAQLLSWKEGVQRGLVSASARPSSSREGIFIFDPALDRSPVSLACSDISSPAKVWWILDTQPVLEALYQGTTVTSEELNKTGKMIASGEALTGQLISRLRGVDQVTQPRYSGITIPRY